MFSTIITYGYEGGQNSEYKDRPNTPYYISWHQHRSMLKRTEDTFYTCLVQVGLNPKNYVNITLYNIF